ncbi:hypothetical protein BGY98DRAFT_622021 [Russula aff. rugulosa BPL654]|nr:hypothetical protein BGY98DRAFT_650641 [Russula aff. rugulosa BPL654]KAI0264301.1 hypothetical protein BGY98DRAFT_622021 [Russula aff. rugulosa BPL654]
MIPAWSLNLYLFSCASGRTIVHVTPASVLGNMLESSYRQSTGAYRTDTYHKTTGRESETGQSPSELSPMRRGSRVALQDVSLSAMPGI